MRTVLGLIVAASCAIALRGQSIAQYRLDPQRITDLPVSHEVTAVTFPGPITAIAGADMLMDDGKTAAEVDEGTPVRFHVSHIPGSNFFLIQSEVPSAAGTLTIIYEGAAYVVQLRSVPANPVASAIFRREQPPPAAEIAQAPQPVKFSPRIGLSVLDRARAYPILARVLPSAVEGVTRRVTNRKIDYPELTVELEEVYRFSNEDALVFLLRLTNKTAQDLHLDPGSFAARVGNEKFRESIASGPRTLPPGASADAEFAVVGMPDGSRNDVSADNAFTISVAVGRPAVAANAETKGAPKS